MIVIIILYNQKKKGNKIGEEGAKEITKSYGSSHSELNKKREKIKSTENHLQLNRCALG